MRTGQFAVAPLIQIQVTVGRGGRGSTMKMNGNTQNGGGGGSSSFGSLLFADGGTALIGQISLGNGGSGGGASLIGSSSGPVVRAALMEETVRTRGRGKLGAQD